MIGQNIVVTVVGVSGDRIRLGISAPAGVPIHREEILERIQQSGQISSAAGPGESAYLTKVCASPCT
jgi:carbon storage regulator